MTLKCLLPSALLLFIVTLAGAQGVAPVVFTYGDQQVSQTDFMRVFEKNNKGDYTEQDIREYLDLYINFRLKVKAALDAQVDTMPGVRRELANYQDQLLNSYVEKHLMPDLLDEAMNRVLVDVRVSHILFPLAEGAAPEDTLRVYNEAMAVRKRLQKGADFAKLAREISTDNVSKDRGGDLGFFTGLQIPFYSLENAAFSTPLNQVSKPTRSRFGYHLIKPTDRRPGLGTMEVAHILLKTPKDATDADKDSIRNLASTLYKELRNGADFAQLAEKWSQDEGSAKKGGVLDAFTVGKMVAPFESACYALKNDGDLSQPIETAYGWHLIKRISRTEPALMYNIAVDKPDVIDEEEPSRVAMKQKIKRDQRYGLARKKLIERWRSELSVMEFPERKEEVLAMADTTLQNGTWKVDLSKFERPLFMVGKTTYTQADFFKHMMAHIGKALNATPYQIMNQSYEIFLHDRILHHGVASNPKFPEYAPLREEYRDGILMFELTEQLVWNRALLDTAGLEAFYEQNKFNPERMWGQRLVLKTYEVKGDAAAAKLRKWVPAKTDDWIAKKLNNKEEVFRVKVGQHEQGSTELAGLQWQIGWLSEQINEEWRTLKYGSRFLAPMPKLLSEARGYFIADYQDYLEKEWVKELRATYPVTINESVVRTLAN